MGTAKEQLHERAGKLNMDDGLQLQL